MTVKRDTGRLAGLIFEFGHPDLLVETALKSLTAVSRIMSKQRVDFLVQLPPT